LQLQAGLKAFRSCLPPIKSEPFLLLCYRWKLIKAGYEYVHTYHVLQGAY